MYAHGGGQGLLPPSGILLLLPLPPLLLPPLPDSPRCPLPLLLLLCKLLLLLASPPLPLPLETPALLEGGAETALASMLGLAAAMLSAATLVEGRTGRSRLPDCCWVVNTGAASVASGGAGGGNNSLDDLLLPAPLLLAWLLEASLLASSLSDADRSSSWCPSIAWGAIR
jgi:hypothetical protein